MSGHYGDLFLNTAFVFNELKKMIDNWIVGKRIFMLRVKYVSLEFSKDHSLVGNFELN